MDADSKEEDGKEKGKSSLEVGRGVSGEMGVLVWKEERKKDDEDDDLGEDEEADEGDYEPVGEFFGFLSEGGAKEEALEEDDEGEEEEDVS